VAGETPQPPESAEPVATQAEDRVSAAIGEERQDLAEQKQEVGAEERRSPVRFWLKVATLLFVVGYSVAFVVGNSKSIHVDFVFGSTNVTLIWSILLLLLIGFVAGVLGSHLYRQRRGKKPRKP
jgi:hypothetical protein